MGSVGTPEILLVLLIALLLFGPTKLPEMGKSLGKAIREFKKASAELQDTIEREVEDLKRDVKEPDQAPQTRPKGALPSPQPRTAAASNEASQTGQASVAENGAEEVKEPAAPGEEREGPVVPGPPEGRG